MSIYEIGVAVQLLAWIIAFIDIIRDRPRKDIYKVLWLLAIFLVPVAGVVIYFLFGRSRQANHERDISLQTDEVIPIESHSIPPEPGTFDDFSNIHHD